MQKLIITCALTGGVPTKEMTPYVPITPKEIAESAYACYNAGASVVHLHARNKKGKPTSNPKVFEDIVTRIRAKCPELIINISTGGRGRKQGERGSALYLKPELASLTTGSVNFSNSAYVNPPQIIDMLAKQMLEYDIKPEIEIFDASMLPNALDLVKRGLLKEPLYLNFIFGMKGATPAVHENPRFSAPQDEVLMEMKYFQRYYADKPVNCQWAVSGIGKSQLEMNLLAMYNGGHVRVGLEDNIYFDKGVLASNEMLVERIARLSREWGRGVASCDEAREILGLRHRA
ncbi:MAG: 3-keto-5-aminohexanoate cleavage protein [Candidatus Nanoarchaeia archaeon]|nr:3-keto-5-aminohexanoate cleavage protein [Candidatus Nanoarchaeia archaeon]